MKTDVLYIAGWGRSGSTILANVLNEIDGYTHIGEMCFVWENAFLRDFHCGCGVPVRKCPFWKNVLDKVVTSNDPRDFARQMISLRNRTPSTSDIILRRTNRYRPDDYAPYQAVLSELYESIHRHTGGVVVDSSKNPFHLFILASLKDIRVHVIHLVRDPRATAFSWMKKRIRKDAGTERTVVMEKFSPITNSRKWTTANLAIEAIRDRFTSYERVHYEDFTASPSSTLSDTLSGMPVPMFPSTLIQNGIVHLGDNHMIWGNPNRKARGPITIQDDTEWLASMSRIDRMKACLWSWPLMVAYGYVPVFPDH